MVNGSQKMCDWCGLEPADSRFREVIGIEELRDQGGANKIIGRKETGRVACGGCVIKIRDGVATDQVTFPL